MRYKKEIIITVISFLMVLFLRYVNIIQDENFLGTFPVILIIPLMCAYIINQVDNQCIQNYKEDRINLENIDFIRYIFAIVVIILHVRPFLGTMDELDLFFNNMISRICVPLFFMITGYFAAKKEVQNPGYIKQYIKGMIPLYLIWSIIYIPVALTWISQYIPEIINLVDSLNIPSMFIPFVYLIGLILVILVAILYVGVYYHLWYFPALILSLIILDKWKKHFNIKVLLMISFFLLLLGATETYYGILPTDYQKVVSYYFTYFLTTRNFLFFGLFYVTLGYCMGKKQVLYTSYSFLKLIICIFLLVAETLFLQSIERLNSNILLACIPLVYYLFISTIYMNPIIKWKPNYSFRNLYKYYYLIHPLVIFLVQLILKDILGYNAFIYRYEIVELVLILGLTHLTTICIIKIKKRFTKLIL